MARGTSSLITGQIPNLFNGVSQQPATLRRTSQGSDQVNMVSSLADGLMPRAGTRHIAKLQSAAMGNAFIHTINRDTTERYKVFIRNGSIKVFNFAGVEQTVNYPDGTTYLASTNPRRDFVVLTIKDYTFVVNKKIVTAMTTKAAGTLTGTKQRFSDLPATPATNDTYKIEGTSDNNFSSFFVKYNGATWEEIEDPRLTQVALNALTMPFELVRTGVGVFTFRKVVWDNRKAGDDTTNPVPSFVGQGIRDIFLHKDRMGFLAGESLCLSEVGADNFFNFFRTTVTTLLDSDPIIVSASDTKVSDLEYAVPFNDSILLFSKLTQYSLSSENLLTPKTVQITPTTSFEISLLVKPTVAGRNIYFAVERDNYTGVKEYFVDADNRGNDAADITKHIPRFIPKNCYKIAASSNEDFLLLLSEDAPSEVSVYQWYWSSGADNTVSKIQSAWHRWVLNPGDLIRDVDIIDTNIYFIIERDDGVYLEVMPFTSKPKEADLGFHVHVDRKITATGVFNPVDGTTTWTLPYEDDGDFTVVRGGAWEHNAGININGVFRTAYNTVKAYGNYSAHPCYVGRSFNKRFGLSPIFIRRANESGSSVAVTTGRLQLRRVVFNYSDSCYFKINVTPEARETYSKAFSMIIGSNNAVIGSVDFESGAFSVQVNSRADTAEIEIFSDSYLPFSILSAEWEGFYHNRAR